MPKKSRSGVARRKAATKKANAGKTGAQMVTRRSALINKHSKNLSGTTKSKSPRKKSRAKARKKVSNKPKRRGF